MNHDRCGAKQPERFDPAKAGILEDASRFDYLPVKSVESLLDIPKGGLLVDFGAGTGVYARELARLRPDATIVAWDEQPRMLDLLREKLAAEPIPKLEPVSASDRELARLRGRADRVLALNVLHEVGDGALGDLASLLKAGGRAVFIDWNAEVDRPVGPPREHVYPPAEAKARLVRLSWKVVAERSFRYQYALTAHTCRRRRQVPC